MNLTLNEQQTPFRLRFAQPISSNEMERFCAENDLSRVERDSSGELIVMSPTNCGMLLSVQSDTAPPSMEESAG